MTERFLTVTREDSVERVVLNRPDVRNALNGELIAELSDWAAAVEDRAARGDVRVAVLAGAGTVFCAGADIQWMAKTVDYTEDENLRDASALSAMFARLDGLPIPLIAQVHGAAIGGGAGLAAVADVVVADEQAVFGFTEVKLGILPAVISPFVLAKIGRSAARELFLTGARFSATRAREIGLAHAVVPAGRLEEAVDTYVAEFLTSAPGAIAKAKSLIADVWGRSPREGAGLTARAIAEQRVSLEGQDGLRAFLEKRPPRWRTTRSSPPKPPDRA